MYQDLGFETLTAPQAAVWFGLAIGVAFGVLAEITRFCFRRAVAGDPGERAPAAGVWAVAAAAAILGTQVAIQAGWIDFSDHRYFAGDMPVAAILAGGLLFGAGMVLTRGCISRLTVLGASGNLRAVTVLLVFAIAAHATLKGVLAPVRTALGSVTVSLGDSVSLAALPGGGWFWAAALATLALLVAVRSGARPLHLGLAALLGLLIPAAWAGTGFVLYDEFDPVALQSLSFTAPAAETLFWTIASTSIPAGFGTGLLGGVLLGALVSSLIAGRFRWQSFSAPAETGRYAAGAVLMGVGGVLAGGCTVGTLSGVAGLSVAALLALAAIAAGAVVTRAAFAPRGQMGAMVPAE